MSAEYQYGIDHRRADIEVTDVDGDPFSDEDHAALEFDEQGYGNSRIVRRVVGAWEEAQRDEDGVIVGWISARNWSEVVES